MYIRNRFLSLIYKVILFGASVYVVLLNTGLLGGVFAARSFLSVSIISALMIALYSIISIVTLSVVISKNGKIGGDGIHPTLKGVCVLSLIISALAYYLLLLPTAAGMGISGEALFAGTQYQLVLPEGVPALLLHIGLPALAFVDWLLFTKKGRLHFTDALIWILAPVAYFCVAVLYAFIGARQGGNDNYPYFFMDVHGLGWTAVLVNTAMLILVFFVLGCIFVLLDALFGILVRKDGDEDGDLKPPKGNNNNDYEDEEDYEKVRRQQRQNNQQPQQKQVFNRPDYESPVPESLLLIEEDEVDSEVLSGVQKNIARMQHAGLNDGHSIPAEERVPSVYQQGERDRQQIHQRNIPPVEYFESTQYNEERISAKADEYYLHGETHNAQSDEYYLQQAENYSQGEKSKEKLVDYNAHHLQGEKSWQSNTEQAARPLQKVETGHENPNYYSKGSDDFAPRASRYVTGTIDAVMDDDLNQFAAGVFATGGFTAIKSKDMFSQGNQQKAAAHQQETSGDAPNAEKEEESLYRTQPFAAFVSSNTQQEFIAISSIPPQRSEEISDDKANDSSETTNRQPSEPNTEEETRPTQNPSMYWKSNISSEEARNHTHTVQNTAINAKSAGQMQLNAPYTPPMSQSTPYVQPIISASMPYAQPAHVNPSYTHQVMQSTPHAAQQSTSYAPAMSPNVPYTPPVQQSTPYAQQPPSNMPYTQQMPSNTYGQPPVPNYMPHYAPPQQPYRGVNDMPKYGEEPLHQREERREHPALEQQNMLPYGQNNSYIAPVYPQGQAHTFTGAFQPVYNGMPQAMPSNHQWYAPAPQWYSAMPYMPTLGRTLPNVQPADFRQQASAQEDNVENALQNSDSALGFRINSDSEFN